MCSHNPLHINNSHIQSEISSFNIVILCACTQIYIIITIQLYNYKLYNLLGFPTLNIVILI